MKISYIIMFFIISLMLITFLAPRPKLFIVDELGNKKEMSNLTYDELKDFSGKK